MPKGGRRPNSGRKPGSANKKTREIADRAAAEGVTPLEVMLQAMRLLWAEAIGNDGKIVDDEKALQAVSVAKDAAPYMHPRLQSIEARVDQTVEDRRPADKQEQASQLELAEQFRVLIAQGGA